MPPELTYNSDDDYVCGSSTAIRAISEQHDHDQNRMAEQQRSCGKTRIVSDDDDHDGAAGIHY